VVKVQVVPTVLGTCTTPEQVRTPFNVMVDETNDMPLLPTVNVADEPPEIAALVTVMPLVIFIGQFCVNVPAVTDKFAPVSVALPVIVQLPFIFIVPLTENALLTVSVTVVALPMVSVVHDRPVVFIVGWVPINAATPICATSPDPGCPVAGDQFALLFQLVFNPRPVHV